MNKYRLTHLIPYYLVIDVTKANEEIKKNIKNI